MNKKTGFCFFLCVSLFASQALELIPKDSRELDNLLSGEKNMDFRKGSEGWRKQKKLIDSEMNWGNGFLYCLARSIDANAKTERGLDIKRYKPLFGNRKILLTGKVKISTDLKGPRGAWFGLWWYRKNWKPASRNSDLTLFRRESTGGEWLMVKSPACSMPDDVGVIRIGTGLHRVAGEASFTDIGVYFAEAPFYVNSNGQTIKKLKIRNQTGMVVYEKSAPIPKEFMLPWPYDFFECEAQMEDGRTVGCTFPAYLKIRNGKGTVPLTKIYYQDGIPADMDAAMEAARIIGKFTGRKPEVKGVSKLEEKDISGALIIGNTLYQSSFIHEELRKYTFAYLVKVVNGAVILGGTNPGIRNDSVYRLFERYGFRFFTKTSRDMRYTDSYDRAEIFPAGDKEIVFDRSYTEKLRFGSLYFPEGGDQGNPCLTDYYRKKQNRGYVGSCHSHDMLVPYSVYAKKHPEYYALLPDGKRLGPVPSMGVHLCMSNPDVVRIATERLLKWIGDQPERTYFDISPSDGPNWCVCKNCMAQDEPETRYAGRVWKFNNQLAKAVKAKYPDKKLISLSYTPCSEAPPKNLPLMDNLVVLFAPYCWGGARSQMHSLTAPVNRIANKNFQDWMNLLKKDQMIGFEYPPTYTGHPSPGMKPLFDKIKYYASYPQVFAFSYCGYSRESFLDMSVFIIFELEKDPGADVNKLMDEFMSNYYGKAAPFMRKIYDRISQIVEKKPHYVRCESYAPGMLTAKEYNEFYSLFKDAEEAVADNPRQLKRVKREKFPYLLCDLTENNPANGRASLDSVFARKLQEWVRIYLEIKDKDWQLFRHGRHWESMKGVREFRDWITNICGLDTNGKHLYQSALIQDFCKTSDPAKFLAMHCNPGKMYPYGQNISLTSSGAKTKIHVQDKTEIQLDEHGEPMAELWLGKHAKNSNKIPVVELKDKETVQAAIDYIDNPYEALLEITACAEEGPADGEFEVVVNPGTKQEERIRKKFKFKTQNKWERIIVPVHAGNLIRGQDKYIHCDEKNLKYGMDMWCNRFILKASFGKGKNILIRSFRLLY